MCLGLTLGFTCPLPLPAPQIRSINLCEQPLTSVALLQPASTSGGSGGRHPLALCGAFDARVHAYSADTGRQLGSFQVAGDAVACVQVVGGAEGSSRLLTAAWDGSLKLWEAAEGREPWAASFAQPLSSAAAPSGVWALAASPEGHTVIAGGLGTWVARRNGAIVFVGMSWGRIHAV